MNTANLKLTALVLTFCFLLVACSGNAGSNNAGSANASAKSDATSGAQGSDGYPPEVDDEFLKSCVDAGSNQKFCACMLEKVKSKYTFEEFSAIESKITAGAPPKEFVEFSGKSRAECMKNK